MQSSTFREGRFEVKEKLVIDAAVAGPALSLPLWVQLFEGYMQTGVTLVVLITVIVRLHIVIKEWKNRK